MCARSSWEALLSLCTAGALDTIVLPEADAALGKQFDGIIRDLLTGVAAQVAQRADDIPVLEACGGVLVAASHEPLLQGMLKESGCLQVLAATITRPPRSRSFLESAAWTIRALLGEESLLDALRQPELLVNEEAQAAFLKALAFTRDRGMSWRTRWNIAQAALHSAALFSTGRIQRLCLDVLATVGSATAPDTDRQQVAALVTPILQIWGRHQADAEVVGAAINALAIVSHDNPAASAALHMLEPDAKRCIMRGVWASISAEDSRCLKSVPWLMASMQGMEGVLLLLREDTSASTNAENLRYVQGYALSCIAELEEGDVATLLRLDAARLCGHVISHCPDALVQGMSALGRIGELLLQPSCEDASMVSEHVRFCVETLLERLRAAVQDRSDASVHAAVLESLHNIACRHSGWGKVIRSTPGLSTLVDIAFERDFSALTFSALGQVVRTLLFLGGVPMLLGKLHLYQDAPRIWQASLESLVEAAEDEPGILKSHGLYLVQLATQAVKHFPDYSNYAQIVAAALDLQGLLLGDLASAVLQRTDLCADGQAAVEEALQQLVVLLGASEEVTCQKAALALTSVCHTCGDLCQGVLHLGLEESWFKAVKQHEKAFHVVSDLVVLLGVLGGFSKVLAFLDAMADIKEAGLVALGELIRMKLPFSSTAERDCVKKVLNACCLSAVAASSATAAAAAGEQQAANHHHVSVAIGLLGG